MSISNNCNFVGRLGKNPKVSSLQNGTCKVQFSIAVKSKSSNKPDYWVNLVAMGKTAESIRDHVTVGNRIGVTAEYQPSSYENKDGERKYTNDFFVRTWEFMDPKSKEVPQNKDQNAGYSPSTSDDPFDV